jgi:mannose-6-phosphate isomerase-like protein (cupin superfamily)
MSEDVVAATETDVGGERMVLFDAPDLLGRERQTISPGIEHEVVWTRGRDRAGLLWFRGDAALPEHAHPEAEHHAWVIEGRARVAGRTLHHPAYWHVPAGLPHDIRGVAPEGCTILYLYLERPERSRTER